MIFRLFGFLAIGWALGFAVFMLQLARPIDAGVRTDAIVVPTGGRGRIDRGLALMDARAARRMLVTGVGPGVREEDLARAYRTPRAVFACCVDLGREAVDTRSNAEETARWVLGRGYRSVRLVTSDWHMARARMELAAAMGPAVSIVEDGVPGEPPLAPLINEYNKLILRRVALWTGMGTLR